MKQMKRVLCLLLSVFLLVGMLAGCSSEETPAATEPNKDAGEQTPVTQPSELGEIDEKQKLQVLPDRAGGDTETKEHTIMVYMVGSDLETNYGAASLDLVEMMESGLDTEKANLVVYAGGAQSWKLGIPSDVNSVLALTPDGTDFEFYGTTQAAINTGDPNALVDFLDLCAAEFPAENYSLIFWDHGGGAVSGFGVDELFKGDGLFLTEIRDALAHSAFANQKLAFVGFDACLMATLETATLFADYAEYFVASEETEPGTGWDYHALSTLNSGDIQDWIDKILSTYETSMKKDRSKPDYTLSSMDLSKVSSANQALDALFAAMRQDILDGNYSPVAQAIEKTRGFGLKSVSKLSKACDHVDIGHLISLLADRYSQQAQAATAALDSLVMDQVSNMKNTNGISMYLPFHNKNLFQQGGYDVYKTTPASAGYHSFLEVYTDMWLDGDLDVEWSSEMPVEEQPDFLTLTLSQEELDNLSRVYYNVFMQTEDGNGYFPISMENRIYADNAGTFTISTDPEVALLKTDLEPEGRLFQLTQVDEESYICQYGVLMTSDDLLSGLTEPVQLSLKRSGNKLELEALQSRDATQEMYGRADVDPDKYSKLTYYCYPAVPTANEDGLLLSCYDWEKASDQFALFGSHYAESFSFELTNLSALEGEFYIQIVGEDTRGEIVLTAWDSLRSNSPYTEETQQTPEGTMTFRVYDDHAEWVDYNGNDTALTVPDTVGGQPVTAVGDNCVSSGYYLSELTLPATVKRIGEKAFLLANLTKVNLPEGLTYLGHYAMANFKGEELILPGTLEYIGFKCFSGAKFETITIPASVKTICRTPFYSCSNLKSIQVEGSSYASVDGVLFSADKKTLIAYPGGAGDTYTVPEGTEVIGHSAFAGNYNMKQVILPETLKRIENFGFGYCESLTDLQLPESLEFIGQGAFGTDIGMPKSDTTKVITIGKHVSYIGADAFSCFNLTEYVVDPDNEHYSSADGCLLNVGGTALISVPYATEGTFEVPYGVCYLAGRSLQDCNGITELILPDTVAAIDLEAGVPSGLQKLTVGVGLIVWENMADYSLVSDVTISEENPKYTVTGGQISEKP